MIDLTHAYGKEHVEELEGVFEEGFLSGGGAESIEWMLRDIDLGGAQTLDFGCGLGGAALTLAERHPIESVIGADVQPYLIATASSRCARLALQRRVSFVCIEPSGPLPFAALSFDVVYSKEAILHIRDKARLFLELRRVLRPTGSIVILDWVSRDCRHSSELIRFTGLDDLPFWLLPVEEYEAQLRDAGLRITGVEDATARALMETRVCLAAIDRQEARLRQRLGKGRFASYMESWMLQEKLLESTEIRVVRLIAKRS